MFRVHSESIRNFSIECHGSADGLPVFIPDPTNCSRYYECQGDWAILMDCAPPLHFDPSVNICNWPSVVNCQVSTTAKPSTTTAEEMTTTKADDNSTAVTTMAPASTT